VRQPGHSAHAVIAVAAGSHGRRAVVRVAGDRVRAAVDVITPRVALA
jgi:hypothetical protein